MKDYDMVLVKRQDLQFIQAVLSSQDAPNTAKLVGKMLLGEPVNVISDEQMSHYEWLKELESVQKEIIRGTV